jgi:heme oxygenase (mycobilin-producing)
MFVAISRFKVANDKGEAVKEAFQKRPHLVDDVEGFVSMEVICPTDDSNEFWLLTHWQTEELFLTWHNSPAHHASHKFIPKGLKLDPSATFVKYFNRIAQ